VVPLLSVIRANRCGRRTPVSSGSQHGDGLEELEPTHRNDATTAKRGFLWFPGRSHLSPDGGGTTRAAVHRLAADGYDAKADDARSPDVATCRQTVEALLAPLSTAWQRMATAWQRMATIRQQKSNYRFDTVLDLVAPLADLVSLTTLAEGAFAGCRKAAWAAANLAIGTRNGLQLT
jgi:hypothetical protein